MNQFQAAVKDFAQQFLFMQGQRQNADYDPAERFPRQDITKQIEETSEIISQFNAVSNAEKRAFALYVLLRAR